MVPSFMQYMLEIVKIPKREHQSTAEMNLDRAGFNVLALTVVVSPPNDLIFQVIDNQLV
jgi:hypothetical protein